MKISVITVCYNAQDVIEETIKSVIAQTYSHIEYVIVDGNSTDNTLLIVNKYKTRINKVISENDKGVYDAMNKGIKVATGDLVFFLNAGDVLFNDKVIQNIVDECNTSNAEILFGDVIILENETGYSRLKDHQSVDKIYFYSNTLCHQGTFFKADVFGKCGLFDESYRISADYEWLLRALFKYNVKLARTNLIISIFKLGGISSNKDFEELHLKERRKIQRIYYSRFERFLFRARLFDQIAAISVRRLLRKLFRWNPRY